MRVRFGIVRQVAFEKRQSSRATRPKSAAPRLSSHSQGSEEDAAEGWRPGQKLRKFLENDGKVLR